MTITPISDQHRVEAEAVAGRLAPVLAAAGVTHDMVPDLHATSWRLAIQIAAAQTGWQPRPGYLPSPLTIRFTATLLRPAPPTPADPFEGLPT